MTYRGLPADYDDWKLRSDRDDDWWNEPEPEPEEESDMDEMAKEIEAALKTDLPNGKLKPFPGNSGEAKQPTLTAQIDALIGGLQSRIRVLEKLRETL